VPLEPAEAVTPAAPALHPVLALQQSAGNAAVARALLQRQETATDPLEGVTQGDVAPEQTMDFDMDKALATNWKRYAKESPFVEKAMWVVGAPQHKWFPRTALKPYEKAFADKLASWQDENGLSVNGELDEATSKALRDAMGPDTEGDTLEERMQERDVEELGEAVAAGGAARNEGEEAARSAIVSIALGEVGKVLDTDRGDGKKVGAERLRTYYRETVPDYTPEVYDKGIDSPGWFPGGTQAKEQRGAWSWCGIYATWRSVRSPGSAGGPAARSASRSGSATRSSRRRATCSTRRAASSTAASSSPTTGRTSRPSTGTAWRRRSTCRRSR
jgi:hypothetical protein